MQILFIVLLLFKCAQFAKVNSFAGYTEELDPLDFMSDVFVPNFDLFLEDTGGGELIGIGSEMDLVEEQDVQANDDDNDEKDEAAKEVEEEHDHVEEVDKQYDGLVEKVEPVREVGTRKSKRVVKVPQRFAAYQQILDEDDESETEEEGEEKDYYEDKKVSTSDDGSNYIKRNHFSIPQLKRKLSPRSNKKEFAFKPASFRGKASNSYPHFIERSRIHQRLLKRFNEAKLVDERKAITPRKVIPWGKLNVEGWPDEVKSKNPRGWSSKDLVILNECVERFKFRWAEPSAELAPSQSALNTKLHSQVVAQAKLLGLTQKTRDSLCWSRIFGKFPEFKLENRDYPNWTAADRENIRTNLIDKIFRIELKKLKRK